MDNLQSHLDINPHSQCNQETHALMLNKAEIHLIRNEAEEFMSLFMLSETNVA